MTTYIIGDVQGCYDELQRLLDLIGFEPQQDKLWLTGDLVNRGPKSLEVLRFVKQMGSTATTVLGNHDLHLLAVACGKGELHPADTLDNILSAPDRDELLHWLRHRPLLHMENDLLLIHAGLAPQWNLSTIQGLATELEDVLRSDSYVDFFANMYGNHPDCWDDQLKAWERLRFITNCFTRLRYLDSEGRLCLSAKGPLGTQPTGCFPWFQHQQRNSKDITIVFGHWSTLGFYQRHNVVSMDTGCLWGGALTALQLPLETDQPPNLHQIQCGQLCNPKQV